MGDHRGDTQACVSAGTTWHSRDQCLYVCTDEWMYTVYEWMFKNRASTSFSACLYVFSKNGH